MQTRKDDAMRVTFIQTGDFREAFHLLQSAGQETYNAQQHSMRIVETLAENAENVSVICLKAAGPYHEKLPNGIDTYGMDYYGVQDRDLNGLRALLDQCRPDKVVLRVPDADIIDACLKQDVHLLPIFADTIAPRRGLRKVLDHWRHRRLAKLLNDRRVHHVGNHNIVASKSLEKIGVAPDKIVPWDWPHPYQPDAYPTRQRRTDEPLRLLYVGTVSEAKGVGNALRALALLPDKRITLSVVGGGDVAGMQALATQLGVAARVDFQGRVGLEKIIPTMLAHDALLVFSELDYPEGLPGVIYQGLASRLPVLASPHPVFLEYFRQRETVLFAADTTPEAYAQIITELNGSPALYESLSVNSAQAYHSILLETDWVDLVEKGLRENSDDIAWLAERSLRTPPTAAE